MSAANIDSEIVNRAFGHVVCRLRSRQGFTTEMLAAAANLEAKRVTEIENGGSADLLEIARLAVGLRITVANLILEFEWSLGERA
jgi:transcriptional regulator with XRE-family HTH domain